MAYELMEGVIDAVKDYLEDNIAAKLNALDTQYDDWALDDIAGWYVSEQPSIPEYPSVSILGDYTEPQEEGSGWARSVNHISIIVCVTDQDTDILRRKIYRYMRAIFELLKTGRSALGYGLVFERIDFASVFSSGSTFITDAQIKVALSKHETG